MNKTACGSHRSVWLITAQVLWIIKGFEGGVDYLVLFCPWVHAEFGLVALVNATISSACIVLPEKLIKESPRVLCNHSFCFYIYHDCRRFRVFEFLIDVTDGENKNRKSGKCRHNISLTFNPGLTLNLDSFCVISAKNPLIRGYV